MDLGFRAHFGVGACDGGWEMIEFIWALIDVIATFSVLVFAVGLLWALALDRLEAFIRKVTGQQ